jgi:hypothetical protein
LDFNDEVIGFGKGFDVLWDEMLLFDEEVEGSNYLDSGFTLRI